MVLLMFSEIGDVSQVIAIGLAAKYGMLSIIIGGGLGHALCIVLAIIVGGILSKYISERRIAAVSAVLFIAFGIRELMGIL